MNDHDFKKLLDWLDLSWEGYYKVRKGVKKRLRKHMQQVGSGSVEEYLVLLNEDAQALEQCRMLLTVSISRFFRDRDLWRVIENRIIPELLDRAGSLLRVWSAGCARGEEIYSFKILWDVAGGKADPLPRLEAWASDLNPGYITAARQGVFSASSLKEMPGEWKQKYFRALPEKPYFALEEIIKEGIFWRTIDLLQDDPPPGAFHLLFLRNNLLTYCTEELLQPALEKITGVLAPGGYLVIGAKEKPPAGAESLVPCGLHRCLLQKR